MDIVDLLVYAVAGLIVFFAIPVAIVYNEAKKGRRALTVKQKNFQIVVKGDTMHEVVCHVPDRIFVRQSDENLLPNMIRDELGHFGQSVVDNALKITQGVDIRTGFVKGVRKTPGKLGLWTSPQLFFLYPLYKPLSFGIDKARRVDKKGVDITEQVKHDTEPISEIRVYPVRAVALPDIEFVGNVRANILLVLSLFIFNPEIFAFQLREKFYQRLEAMILEAFQKYAGTMKWEDFITRAKAANGTPTATTDFFRDHLVPILGIMTSELGVMVTEVSIEAYELGASDREVADALKAEQLAIAQAKGTVAEARGKAEAIRLQAEAFATGLQLLVEAGKNNPAAVIAELRRRGLTETQITTLVEGGGQAMVTIPATPAVSGKSNSTSP